MTPDKMGLLVEIWGTASDEKCRYQIVSVYDLYRGGFWIMAVQEIDHEEVPTRGRPEYVNGPRMRVTFDLIVGAQGLTHASAVQNFWAKTVEWMKPRVKEGSKIMSFIRQGESS